MILLEKIKEHFTLESYIAVATVVALSGYWLTGFSFSATVVLLVVVVLGSVPLVIEITQSIIKKDFGVDLIALLAIVSAVLIGEYSAAGLILLMLSGGEALERYAEGRARSSLKSLIDRMPTHAHVLVDGVIVEKDLSALQKGDVIIVRPQEVIPIDGLVSSGKSSVDESMITGEPLPRGIAQGAKVYAGSVNQGEPIHVHVQKLHTETAYAGIVRLVKQAEETRAPLVRMADQYAVAFTAITLTLAGIAYVGMGSATLAVAVLVVATPCPLILAAPIAFIAGMSRAAQRGVIVKHGGVFEGITRSNQFFFDKTGTLTFGVPKVSTVTTYGTLDQHAVLRFAASLEQLSTHVIGRGVVEGAREQGLVLMYPTDTTESYGNGIVGMVDGSLVHAGKAAFLKEQGIEVSPQVESDIASIKAKGGVVVCVAVQKQCVGVIGCEDIVRPDVTKVMHTIADAGFTTTLVTGDSEERAHAVQTFAGIHNVIAHCLPEDKVKAVRAHEEKGEHVIMVGDGINDAPALAAATVGVALGSHGETATTESAHAVIMVDDIGRVAELILISKRTMSIARQSILVGITLSVCAMIFALFGFIPPVVGAFLQEGIDVAVILNALRVLY